MPGRVRRSERGQGAVEFALTMPVVFLIILGCIELGFAFHAYLTVISAAREGARAGAVYLYDSNLTYTQADNDLNRESGNPGMTHPYTDNVRDVVQRSLGVLKRTAPNFDKSDDSYVRIQYTHVGDGPQLATRKGDLISVEVHYKHDFLTQFLGTSITMTSRASARIE